MANYIPYARSNYYRVKDDEAYIEEIESISGCELITDGEGRHGILFEEGIPSWMYDEDLEEDVEIDFCEIVSKHLADDEVAIFQEIGFEKMRYLTGYALAVNSKNESRQIGICDIYDLAKELGANVTPCVY